MALGNFGKYSQMLQNMPNPNTGTHAGGLSHVLQQALLGYSAGQDQREEEAKRTRLADALRIGMGTPGNPITDAPGAFAAGAGGPPPMSMDPARQPVAGDRQGMIAALGDFPELQLNMINEDMSAAAAAEAAEALYDRTRADELFDIEAANVYDTEAARLALEGKIDLAEIKAAGGGGGDLGSYDTYLDPVNGPVTMRAGEAAALGFVKYDAPGDLPSANFVTFTDGNGRIESVDVSTPDGRAWADELAATGFYPVNITAPSGADLMGTNVPGPTDAAGKVIAPEPGYYWEADDSEFGWRQSPIRGAAPDRETIAANAKIVESGTYMVGLLDELLDHPGLEGSVGVPSIEGLLEIPGTDEVGFKARLAQVDGKLFLEAYEQLKGGGVITEIEGTKATQAMARMEAAQREEEFIAAVKELRGIIQTGMDRLNADPPVYELINGKLVVKE